MTTKLDEMIQHELDNYYLNPEGDYLGEYTVFLPDDSMYHSEQWDRAIRESIDVELTDDEVEAVIENLIQWDHMWEISITHCLYSARVKGAFASFVIGELEIQLPDDLDSYESDDFHVVKQWGNHLAYVDCTYDVVTFTILPDELAEFISELRGDLEVAS